MREFQKHRTKQHHVLRFFALLGAVCAMFLLTSVAVKATWTMYGKFSEASSVNASTKLELSLLEAREAKVGAALLAVSSNRGMETQVRERFGVARPGEGEIHIVRDGSTDEAVQPAQNENFFVRVFHSLVAW